MITSGVLSSVLLTTPSKHTDSTGKQAYSKWLPRIILAYKFGMYCFQKKQREQHIKDIQERFYLALVTDSLAGMAVFAYFPRDVRSKVSYSEGGSTRGPNPCPYVPFLTKNALLSYPFHRK